MEVQAGHKTPGKVTIPPIFGLTKNSDKTDNQKQKISPKEQNGGTRSSENGGASEPKPLNRRITFIDNKRSTAFENKRRRRRSLSQPALNLDISICEVKPKQEKPLVVKTPRQVTEKPKTLKKAVKLNKHLKYWLSDFRKKEEKKLSWMDFKAAFYIIEKSFNPETILEDLNNPVFFDDILKKVSVQISAPFLKNLADFYEYITEDPQLFRRIPTSLREVLLGISQKIYDFQKALFYIKSLSHDPVIKSILYYAFKEDSYLDNAFNWQDHHFIKCQTLFFAIQNQIHQSSIIGDELLKNFKMTVDRSVRKIAEDDVASGYVQIESHHKTYRANELVNPIILDFFMPLLPCLKSINALLEGVTWIKENQNSWPSEFKELIRQLMNPMEHDISLLGEIVALNCNQPEISQLMMEIFRGKEYLKEFYNISRKNYIYQQVKNLYAVNIDTEKSLNDLLKVGFPEWKERKSDLFLLDNYPIEEVYRGIYEHTTPFEEIKINKKIFYPFSEDISYESEIVRRRHFYTALITEIYQGGYNTTISEEKLKQGIEKFLELKKSSRNVSNKELPFLKVLRGLTSSYTEPLYRILKVHFREFTQELMVKSNSEKHIRGEIVIHSPKDIEIKKICHYCFIEKDEERPDTFSLATQLIEFSACWYFRWKEEWVTKDKTGWRINGEVLDKNTLENTLLKAKQNVTCTVQKSLKAKRPLIKGKGPRIYKEA